MAPFSERWLSRYVPDRILGGCIAMIGVIVFCAQWISHRSDVGSELLWVFLGLWLFSGFLLARARGKDLVGFILIAGLNMFLAYGSHPFGLFEAATWFLFAGYCFCRMSGYLGPRPIG